MSAIKAVAANLKQIIDLIKQATLWVKLHLPALHRTFVNVHKRGWFRSVPLHFLALKTVRDKDR